MTTTPQIIGFVIEKAPEGGYKLSRLAGGEDGQLNPVVVAYCSTLAETQAIEHQKKQEMFGERAWYPTIQAKQATSYAEAPDPDMPAVVAREQLWPNNGLMDRLGNGARAAVPFLFLTGLGVGVAAQKLLA